MATSKRLDHVDIAKGIGILLVLLGHLIPNFYNLKSMIYTFHMPLFFILFGCVMKDEPIKECITKRWRQLIIPYILWALIYAKN